MVNPIESYLRKYYYLLKVCTSYNHHFIHFKF